LLIYLSVVDILLHRVVGDETVDKTASPLTVAVDTTDGLTVMTRVPRRVKDDDTTCTNQVDTKAARPADQQHSVTNREQETQTNLMTSNHIRPTLEKYKI